MIPENIHVLTVFCNMLHVFWLLHMVGFTAFYGIVGRNEFQDLTAKMHTIAVGMTSEYHDGYLCSAPTNSTWTFANCNEKIVTW